MSRKKPVARDTSVKPPTVKMRPIIGRAPCLSCGDVTRIEAQLYRSAPPMPPAQGTSRKMDRPRSPTQRAPHGGDDPVLGHLVEIGVHGQADHFLGQPFAHRRAAGGDREALVRLLAVQRGRVMDRGWNALAL